MIPQRISFARTLPIVAFLLSYVIIAIAATMAYVNLKHPLRDRPDEIVFNPHGHFLRFSISMAAEFTSDTIQAINTPAFSIELAIDRSAKTWPTGWTPFGLDFRQWRALIFPVYCLPFWWFAGLGLDALSGSRKLRWWVLLAGSLLWVFIVFLLCGLCFGLPASERHDMVFPYWGFAIWVALLVVFPLTWIKQALARRRIKTSLQARLFAELQ